MSKLQFLRAGVVAATMPATPGLAHENHVKSQHRAENATVSTALGRQSMFRHDHRAVASGAHLSISCIKRGLSMRKSQAFSVLIAVAGHDGAVCRGRSLQPRDCGATVETGTPAV